MPARILIAEPKNGRAAQVEFNAVPPLRNDGEFPRLSAGALRGPTGGGVPKGQPVLWEQCQALLVGCSVWSP